MNTAIPQQGAGELNESEMIEPVLVVADEERAALRQPGQRAFHDPTSRFVFLVSASGGLFADAANVRNVLMLGDGGVAGRIVVALVQAQVLFLHPPGSAVR